MPRPKCSQRKDLDWFKIKGEYITTKCSYADLAKKYNVNKTTLANRAKEEDWTGERERHANETLLRTIKGIEKEQSARMMKLFSLTDNVLNALTDAIEGKNGEEARALVLSNPKQVTGAIKDIKEIYMLRSSGDLAEQEARINKLRRDAEKVDEENSTIQVVFGTEEGQEGWAE